MEKLGDDCKASNVVDGLNLMQRYGFRSGFLKYDRERVEGGG